MTLADLIAAVDLNKPNAYDKHIKTTWVNEVEFKVITEVLNRAEGVDIEFKPFEYDLDDMRELSLPAQFTDIYMMYLYAKIDFNNSEIGRYNNSVAMFEAAFSDFASYYKRTHKPKVLACMRPF